MNKYEFKFYVGNRFKAVKEIKADSYADAFKKAHDYADTLYTRRFVEIACRALWYEELMEL